MAIYENGAVHTMDQAHPGARFLVTDRGTIAYVGDNLPARYQDDERIDLTGQAVIPLLVDSHIHFSSFATFSAGLYVYDARNLDELFEMIKVYAGATRGPILGFGISPWAMEEQRLPTRKELDQASDRPIFIVKYDGHSAVVNSSMLQALPGNVGSLRGYDADSGLIEQEAFFRGVMAVTEKISALQIIKNLNGTAHAMALAGFGMVHAAEGVGFKNDLDVHAMSKLSRGFELETRLFFQTMDLGRIQKLGLPRVGGCFACALDGSFGTRDAALHHPYRDDDNNRGVLFFSQEVVDEFVASAHDAGLQVAMHAIGDRAVTQALDAFERAIKRNPRSDHRHTIIHASLVNERDKDRLAELGIFVANQPAILTLRQEPRSFLEEILGDRANQFFPLNSLANRGVQVSFGSDGPVTLPSLGTSLDAAVNHPSPDEAVDVQSALRMHTLQGCANTFDEDSRGILAAGRRADFAILAADPVAMDPAQLSELKVSKVIHGGEVLRTSPGGAASLLWRVSKGLLSGRKV